MSISEEPIDWPINLNEFMRSQLFSQTRNGKYDMIHSRNHRKGKKKKKNEWILVYARKEFINVKERNLNLILKRKYMQQNVQL